MIYFSFQPGLPDQTLHATLDGQPVTIRLLWNERFKHWTMNLSDRQGAPIIAGVRLTRDYPLISRFNLSSLAGDFIFYRLSGSKVSADFDSIGYDYDLVYLSKDELDVIQSYI